MVFYGKYFTKNMTLDLRLERSLCPRWVPAFWVRIPAVAGFLSVYLKVVIRIFTYIRIDTWLNFSNFVI